MLRFVIFIGIVALTAACNDKGEQKNVRDVKWFLANPGERKAATAECDNNPGELEKTPNCMNAYKAAEEAMSQQIQDAINRDSKR